jgi:Cu-Zn family superoxide dismutase
MRVLESSVAIVLLLSPLACDRGATPREDPSPATSAEGNPAVAPMPTAAPVPGPEKKALKAEADFEAVDTIKLDGTAKLTEVDDGVQLVIEVEDAPPGKKGIHVHEKGDCSDIAGKSMKEHLKGDGHRHGLPTTAERHLGDLGNIEIDKEGNGKLETVVKTANLRTGEDPKSFLGRAIVIHTSEDTEKDPGGTPIACAVIKED